MGRHDKFVAITQTVGAMYLTIAHIGSGDIAPLLIASMLLIMVRIGFVERLIKEQSND